VNCDCISLAGQDLELCHPSLPLQIGALIEHSMNARAVGEHRLRDLLLIRLQLRREAKDGDIPDDMKAIGEGS